MSRASIQAVDLGSKTEITAAIGEEQPMKREPPFTPREVLGARGLDPRVTRREVTQTKELTRQIKGDREVWWGA